MSNIKTLNNKGNETVFNELKNSIRKGSKLSVISAYFTMYAYFELQKELDKIDDMRFIFTTPSFIKNKDDIDFREYFIDNSNDIFGNEFEIKLRNEMTQSSISKECSDWLTKKVEIKSFKKSNLAQPRMIHVNNKNIDDIVINGTVDFTTDGLGITYSNRTDSNIFMSGNEVTDPQLISFNALWENEEYLEDVKDEVLKQMNVMYKENSPEFIYFVSLYNIFHDYLNELDETSIIKKGNKLKDKKIWNKLYKFQQDAVIGAISKIENYNGCILADSVGLGKTFTALAIIQYYELRNDRVLVLVPKKLRENWTIYTLNDTRNIFAEDRFRYDVLNHTDLSRNNGKSGDIDLENINWGNYDLVVIDESHNFRNNPPVKDHVTRYERLMRDVIKSGHKTKLLMLSATPVNNRMNDIKNQIAFITEGNDYALNDIGINSIKYTLRKAQGIFNEWSKLDDTNRTGERFVNSMDLDYFKLLDTFTIARSRKHIEKYYDLSEIGDFPERLDPINQSSNIDINNEFPSLKEVNDEISRLNLSIYSPFLYILPPKKAYYEELYDDSIKSGKSVFKQRDREINLVHLMRTNLLKRMESSVYSFKLTIKNILKKINKTLDKIDKQDNYQKINIKPINLNDTKYDQYSFGKTKKVLYQDLDLIKWKQDLYYDKTKLENLLQETEKITPDRDEKLQDLKKQITTKINNPINENNKKVIIFTAFADTAKYLYENISPWAQETYNIHSALVTGNNENKTTLKKVHTKDINDILTNFSPISKERNTINPKTTKEIDILIATDCISEGQNLQDCDYLINYDIHWNPVRIIQRFGRIDRIGSINKQIQLVNFWPNIELDEYINLKGRVESRMVMADVSATGEENVINKTNIMNDLEYRKTQLEKLQNEVIDLEDISNGISITDLTFNDFKVELMNYMKKYKKELENTPSGIYSIVPKNELEKGVIFLLKQTTGKKENKDQNPLSPYYLIYITSTGEIKLNHIQSKKIMDNYKKLCYNTKEIYKNLITEFEKETQNGKEMNHYTKLLADSIENIQGKKEEIGVKSLFSKGGTITTRKDISGLEEFELITFLILK
ncbi:MAG: helicase-related protein [Methanobacteriaceae archaeon]|nr:helicase-related protein [Methanobacteriaceae archaeon]